MRTTAILTLLVGLGNVALGQPDPPNRGEWKTPQRALLFAWPSSGAAAATIRQEDVLDLLKRFDEFWGDGLDLQSWGWDFRFAPLSEGKFYLIVTEHCKSDDCGSSTALYCERNRCFSAGLPAPVDLKNGVVDVDGDGLAEIVGKECIDDCYGSPTLPRLPVYVYSIYKFVEGAGFVDYSAKAAGYYREHLLPKIEEARKGVEARVATFNQEHGDLFRERGLSFPPAGQMQQHKAATQYAYDDYLRRVQGEKDAGLENALHWMESEYTKYLGIDALARIPNQIADQKLTEAARSTDRRFAERAAGLLEFRSKLKARGMLK
ncbi:MAG TPA: hypothetical protein VH639_12605 [Bryobacteraceae bacterium]|jgi:hypothetical protein